MRTNVSNEASDVKVPQKYREDKSRPCDDAERWCVLEDRGSKWIQIEGAMRQR